LGVLKAKTLKVNMTCGEGVAFPNRSKSGESP